MTIQTQVRGMVEARPEDVGMSSARLGRLTALVQGYIDAGKYAGAITVVARRGETVLFETFGDMDAETGKAMEPDTIFRLASMTKPIVSVGLMTLYEEGQFQLDTPVAEFIPAFADLQVFAGGTADAYDVRPASRAVTILDLLTHTAGFEALSGLTPVRELYRRARFDQSSSGTLEDRAAALAALPLVCDPGEQFNYNYATDIVGRLCEIISGQRLDEFLAERITGPLGMADTSFHVPAPKRDRFAALYEQVDEGAPRYRRAPAEADARYEEGGTFLSAGGGLTSTASDYLRFCKMLAGNGELAGERILGPRTLALMTKNHLPEGRELQDMIPHPVSPTWIAGGTGFGLGFAVLLDPVRAKVLGTPGEYYWGGATSTAFFVSPAEDLIMLFMTQLRGSNYLTRRELRVATYQAIID